jgi:VanZ family protein
MERLHRPQVQRLCAALWCLSWLAVAALLLLPMPSGAPNHTDLVAHVVLFGGMAFTTVAFSHHSGRLALLALATLAAATALEFGQNLVPRRSFDEVDLLANLAGAVIGYVLAVITLHWLILPARPQLEGTPAGG